MISWVASRIAHAWRGFVGVVLVAGLGVGVAALAGLLPSRDIGLFCALFLILYAGIVGLSRLPASVLGRSIDRRLEAWVASSGRGFYGLLAGVRFLQLELASMAQALAEAVQGAASWKQYAMEWVTGFSLESMSNLISGLLWPLKMVGSLGVYAAALWLVPLWLVYALGARAFPEVDQRIGESADLSLSPPTPPPAPR